MENLEFQNQTKTLSNTFVANVFMWMFVALGITAITAYLFGTNAELISMMLSQKSDGSVGISLFGWIVMLAPLIIVFIMSARIEKMKASTMVSLYVVYSILMGMSLCFIFLAFTTASIFKTFIIAGGMFGIMAIVGYTTNTDLTKLGSLLFMGLIGIIIASLINMFMGSERLDYIISILGVIIFTGLTAYDVQKIKQIGMEGMENNDTMMKITIHAALNLYLDFLNLFLYLLRFFGKGKN
ncbi:MAG: Bax inhibitor-1/YccA family protein [Bacteroidales bacterium]|nr:Bax inhibitor-1/YccA family protein [Bacteroidales bacterium]